MGGYEVIATVDGETALNFIEDSSFDLVLTDLRMHPINGVDIARRVKSLHANTPVILITGWINETDKEDIKTIGIDLVLSKPIELSRLSKAISLLLP